MDAILASALALGVLGVLALMIPEAPADTATTPFSEAAASTPCAADRR